MRWVTRGRTRAAIALAAAVAVLTAVDGARLWRELRLNDAIATGRLPVETRDAPVELQFAQAHAQAASGADDAALNRYRALQDDASLGQLARYNGANLLLRQAERLRDGAQAVQAIPLIELAKETYREVLRRDPAFWNARYNLERAQRLLPEPEEADLDPPDLARSAERAATTMRGYSPGLP